MVADLLPLSLRANLGCHGRVVEVVVKWGRVRVRIGSWNIIYIPVSRERPEDVVVAEVLGSRADRVVPATIARNDLRHY
jgi:hypothetical protein